MGNISELLNSDLGKQIISGIGKQTGTSEKDTASVVSAATPILMGMLQKNASSEQGATGILGALSKHDGSILDNLSGFLSSGDTADGNGILGHILGSKKDTVEKAISQQTGVSSANTSKIIAMLAPIVMGYLGKESKGKNVTSGGGLGGLLGGLLGGSSSSSSSVGGNILSSLLDQDGDGKLGVNDVITAISGKKKKSGGLGGLLGGLFGKK